MDLAICRTICAGSTALKLQPVETVGDLCVKYCGLCKIADFNVGRWYDHNNITDSTSIQHLAIKNYYPQLFLIVPILRQQLRKGQYLKNLRHQLIEQEKPDASRTGQLWQIFCPHRIGHDMPYTSLCERNAMLHLGCPCKVQNSFHQVQKRVFHACNRARVIRHS